MGVTLASWNHTWQALGVAHADEAWFHRLIAAYSEPQRHYHTLQHLRECLAHAEGAQQLAERPAEVLIALWFHDAVYDVHGQDNEERSADWARDSLLAAGLPLQVGERVHALVMDTKHTGAPADADARLLVDADLAILGAPRERFDEFEAQIRREYAHVPLADFSLRRCTILQSFLDRPRLYGTDAFADRFEAQARQNLRQAIDHWRNAAH